MPSHQVLKLAVAPALLVCQFLQVVSPVTADAGVSLRKVFSTREKLVLASDRARVGSFGSPSINDFGEVAVLSSLYGPKTSVRNAEGIIFGKTAAQASIIARRGPYNPPELASPYNLTNSNPTITKLNDLTILTNERQVLISGEVSGRVKDKPNTPTSITPPVQITGDYVGIASPEYKNEITVLPPDPVNGAKCSVEQSNLVDFEGFLTEQGVDYYPPTVKFDAAGNRRTTQGGDLLFEIEIDPSLTVSEVEDLADAFGETPEGANVLVEAPATINGVRCEMVESKVKAFAQFLSYNSISYVIYPVADASGNAAKLYKGETVYQITVDQNQASLLKMLQLTEEFQKQPKVAVFAAEGDLTDYFARFPCAFYSIRANASLTTAAECAINNYGRISFIGHSTNDNPQGEYDGVWYGKAGAARCLTTIGSVVHGLPYYSNYASFGDTGVNNSGKVYTIATITNKGQAYYGIWAGTNGFMNPVVTKLTEKPETESETTRYFGSFTTPITVSRSGNVLAFPADGALWVKKGARLREIAKPQSIVGKESKDRSKNDIIQSLVPGAAVNRRGQIAFIANTNLDGTVKQELIVSSPTGRLEAIARVGSDLKVDGKSKRIIDIVLNRKGGLNNRGVVAFTASFSDRTSAVFVARIR